MCEANNRLPSVGCGAVASTAGVGDSVTGSTATAGVGAVMCANTATASQRWYIDHTGIH
jgi:hypothetical protein